MKGDGGKKNKKKTFVHCLLIKQVKVASNWPLLLSQKKKKKKKNWPLLIHCQSP